MTYYTTVTGVKLECEGVKQDCDHGKLNENLANRSENEQFQ